MYNRACLFLMLSNHSSVLLSNYSSYIYPTEMSVVWFIAWHVYMYSDSILYNFVHSRYLQGVDEKPRTKTTGFLARRQAEDQKLHELGEAFLKQDEVRT